MEDNNKDGSPKATEQPVARASPMPQVNLPTSPSVPSPLSELDFSEMQDAFPPETRAWIVGADYVEIVEPILEPIVVVPVNSALRPPSDSFPRPLSVVYVSSDASSESSSDEEDNNDDEEEEDDNQGDEEDKRPDDVVSIVSVTSGLSGLSTCRPRAIKVISISSDSSPEISGLSTRRRRPIEVISISSDSLPARRQR